MFVIGDSQVTTFEKVYLNRYVIEMMNHCREFSPRLCDTLNDEQLEFAIKTGIKKASKYGFTQRGPVRFYIDMMVILGSGFDTDPQYPWVKDILCKNDLNQMTRAECLYEKICLYLKSVDGKNNIYTLKALADLRSLNQNGIDLYPEYFTGDLIKLLNEIHPRKFKNTGERLLRILISNGIKKGKKTYNFKEIRSFAVIVVLMFSFGHQIDIDPFHPWVSRTLRKKDLDNPDLIAEKLERRAFIWLDAVLKNAKEDS